MALGGTSASDTVAGHPLGGFPALVASHVSPSVNTLRFVSERIPVTQVACEAHPPTMAATIGLSNEEIEGVCHGISDRVAAPTNYNCSDQVVISGTMEGIVEACEQPKTMRVRRALSLKVGGAFHLPLTQPARERL